MVDLNEKIKAWRESEKRRTPGEWITAADYAEVYDGVELSECVGSFHQLANAFHVSTTVSLMPEVVAELEATRVKFDAASKAAGISGNRNVELLRENETLRARVAELKQRERTHLANIETLKETVELEREENETLRPLYSRRQLLNKLESCQRRMHEAGHKSAAAMLNDIMRENGR